MINKTYIPYFPEYIKEEQKDKRTLSTIVRRKIEGMWYVREVGQTTIKTSSTDTYLTAMPFPIEDDIQKLMLSAYGMVHLSQESIWTDIDECQLDEPERLTREYNRKYMGSV